MKQKFIEWFTKSNNGCSPAMEDDRSFVHEKTQHMFEAYQAGVTEGEARCAALAAELKQSKIDADCYKKGMEASNARLVQIAAELSAIDAIHNDAVFITDDHYEQCPPEVQKMIRSLAVLQIPAYDAFLAEVRAQGVEMFAHDVGESEQGNGLMKAIGRRATKFAAQLRKGAAL